MRIVPTLAACGLMACADGEKTATDTTVDGAADTDADTDTDTDTDADTDADTDTDSPIELACAEVDGVPFPDLTAAFAAATEGSTVHACPGTHLGPFVAGVAIALVSDGDPALTILSGQLTGTTLVVAPGTTIDGVTIRDGNAVNGGGLALSAAGGLTVTNSVLTENSAHRGGGAWLPGGSTVAIVDSTVTLNRAELRGGGFATEPGVALDLTGTSVSVNAAEESGGGGLLDGSTLDGGTIEGNFSNSMAPYDPSQVLMGGGLEIVGESTVTGTVITANNAQLGGGIWIHGGVVSLVDVIVSANVADGGAAGVLVDGSTVSFEGLSSVEGNIATGAGGGLYAWDSDITGGRFAGNSGSYGGGVAVAFGTLTGADVDGNTAQSFGGGALVLTRGEIHSTVLRNNVCAQAAGAYTTASSVEPAVLVDVDVIDNQGVGLGSFEGFGWAIEGSRVLRNTAGGAASAGFLQSTDTDWGSDADDNVGFDLMWNGQVYVGYGPGASFVCDELCDPIP